MAKIRRRRSSRRLFRGIIFLIISAAVLGFFVYVPFFTLSELKLVGAKYLTQDDILKAGNIYMGEPMFKLETDVVQSRLSKDLRIEEVSVRRRLPHTLEIKIKERRPLATIICDYGYLDLDHNGMPELLAASQHQADRATTLKVWELGENMEALYECSVPLEEGESFPDILSENADTFHDTASDTWSYLFYDDILLSEETVESGRLFPLNIDH